MYQVVAELRPKLLQRTLEILVDFGSGLDPLAAGQITADKRVTAVEVTDERQSPIAPAWAPHLDVELRGFGDLGHLHGHVGERIAVEHGRPEPDVLALVTGGHFIAVRGQVFDEATLDDDTANDFRPGQDTWLHDDAAGWSTAGMPRSCRSRTGG